MYHLACYTKFQKIVRNKLNYNGTVIFPINHLKEGIASISQQNETQIEESIIPKNHPENNDEFFKNTGTVIAQNLVPGKFIHFSADNINIRD